MALTFKKHQFANGLRLIVHENNNTPMATFHVTYNVGARCENPERTGLAHLLEHYMFCGSINVPKYDEPLQKIGAINNAYTSSDLTCYYINLPANNIETAFWLESDRMLSLAFDNKSLEIQKSVVMEEFKEMQLNRPYSDLWSLFHEMVYKKHPYRWLVIGKELSHIENATMDDVRNFYNKYYIPNNAVVAISGNVKFEEMVRLGEKWFSDIPAGVIPVNNYPKEPLQTEARLLEVKRDAPNDMLVKGWKMCERKDNLFYACDLLSDLLGSGYSSYLNRELVLKNKIFTDINVYITANIEPGMFVFVGRPQTDVDLRKANDLLSEALYNFHYEPEDFAFHLQKVKNRVESVILSNEMKAEDCAAILASSEIIDSAEAFNNDRDRYFAVTEAQIMKVMEQYITPEKESTLLYEAN
mgnify:FL=1